MCLNGTHPQTQDPPPPPPHTHTPHPTFQKVAIYTHTHTHTLFLPASLIQVLGWVPDSDSQSLMDVIAWEIYPDFQRIRLSPVAFALEPSDGCVYDYVQVYDGESPEAMSLGRFCGITVPATTESSSNDLLIKFKSDASVTASGFKFNYATIQGTVGPAVCGGTLTETSGTLSSPNFGAGRVYPNDAVCTWKIAAPDGNVGAKPLV